MQRVTPDIICHFLGQTRHTTNLHQPHNDSGVHISINIAESRFVLSSLDVQYVLAPLLATIHPRLAFADYRRRYSSLADFLNAY